MLKGCCSALCARYVLDTAIAVSVFYIRLCRCDLYSAARLFLVYCNLSSQGPHIVREIYIHNVATFVAILVFVVISLLRSCYFAFPDVRINVVLLCALAGSVCRSLSITVPSDNYRVPKRAR